MTRKVAGARSRHRVAIGGLAGVALSACLPSGSGDQAAVEGSGDLAYDHRRD